MPRIAATLGVFGLVVLALGLNIAQFPIQHGVVSPAAVSADLEESISPHDSRTPAATRKSAAETSAKSPWEARQTEASAYEASPDPCDGVSGKSDRAPDFEAEAEPSPPPLGATIVPSDVRERSGAEEGSESAEDDSADAADPAGSQGKIAPQQSEGGAADEAVEPHSLSELRADSAIRTASPAANSTSAPGKTEEPHPMYAAGGVYNPLEPEPKSAAGMPAEALPSPPYAAVRPSDVTAGRAMVPIEQDTGTANQTSTAAGEVTRLPLVDNVWPGAPTDQPPSEGRLSGEGYPTTQLPE